MFENIAAIDIGTSSIKIVTVKTGFRDFQVSAFTYEDIDQNIEDPRDAIREALTRALGENELGEYKLLVNLPMEKAIIRNITFPFNDFEKIAEAIPFEAEENVPFKLDDLSMDFQRLKSNNPEEGRVLLAATHKVNVQDYLTLLNEFDLHPIRMGLESDSLFECYRYFNKIDDETVIQLDIGYTKTVINIITENSLLYTRSIPIGVSNILDEIASVVNSSREEANSLFENLNLDMVTLDNNLQRENYKKLKINKAKLKQIYTKSNDVIAELINQVSITLKSFMLNFSDIEFNRILLSGGGSSITGIGTIISNEFDIPVVSLPFMDEYSEVKIRSQFPISFGAILAYLNRKSNGVNFLKGDFLPDIVSSSRKIYYLSGAFGVLSAIVLIIYIITSSVMKSGATEEYDIILQERFKKYFHSKKTPDDPIKEAMKMLTKEKKEFDSLKGIMQSDEKVLDMLKDVISDFPDDSSFDLRNLVLNERALRIDGNVVSSNSIDEFKNKLNESKKFASVNLNTNMRKNQVRFTLNIKLKLKEKNRPTKKVN